MRDTRAPSASKISICGSGVGDVVLAADDMAHLEIDIVGDGRQRVEETAVLADQHRIGECRGVDLDIAAQTDRAISLSSARA